LSSELPVGPSILGKAGRGKPSSALNLPSSPSAAFSDFSNPFTELPKPKKERGPLNLTPSIDIRTSRELGIASFKVTDFRGPRGDFAKKSFNINVTKTFGPHNLPRKKQNFTGFDF